MKEKMIKSVAQTCGFTRHKSWTAVETLLEIMKETLATGEDVLISGFGKFCIKDKNRRKGRNLVTGNNITLRPRRVVNFQCSGVLKNKLNKKL